jgi:YidC/Oxa1 family membrane protein insertase
MDKNQTIGLVLISALLIAYLGYFSLNPPPAETQTETPITVSDTIRKLQADQQKQAEQTLSNLPDSVLRQQKGVFAAGMKGEATDVVLENKNIKVILSSLGGKIKSVEMKNYKTYNQLPLFLYDDRSKMNLEVETTVGKVDFLSLYYKVVESTPQKVVFRMLAADNQYIEQIYSLEPESFSVAYQLRQQGMESSIKSKSAIFAWESHLKQAEKSLETCRTQATVNFYTVEGDLESIAETSTDFEELKAEKSVKWVAHKQKFFNAGIVTEKAFNTVYTATEVDKKNPFAVKQLNMSFAVPMADLADEKANIRFAFAPNDYDIADKIAEGYEKNVYLGWKFFAPINIYIMKPVFTFFEGFTTNYGIVIFLLVLFIKTMLFPLVYKAYLSMAKTRVLKPEMDEIRERCGDDMLKIQQEQMELYKKVGVNPLSGCVPMLAQMPILLAMFNFFPNLIDLRQKGFLWADDLSSYDTIVNLPFVVPFYGDHVSLFTILMTISTLVYTYYNNQMTMSSSNPQQAPMIVMSYAMPVIFMFVLNSFSSGLTYYYFLSNVITIAQQLGIRRFVDDKKIREVLDANQKKNANKPASEGGFASRLTNMMKAQAEAAKQQQQDKKDNKNKK